jgi:tetratricopeptide (TPR) repeat protein
MMVAGLALWLVAIPGAQAADVGFSTRYTRQCKPLGISQKAFDQLPKRPLVAPKESTYKRIVRAQEKLGEQKFDEALEILLPLEERVRGRAGDHSTVLQVLAVTYSQKGDYKKAIEYFKKALDLKVLPYRIEQQMLAQVASLYMATDDYKNGAKYIEAYFKHAVNPGWQHYELLAGAYGRLDRFKEAICPMYLAVVKWHEKQEQIKAAIAKAKAEGKPLPAEKPEATPKASWYSFLAAAHMQLKDYAGAVSVYRAALHYFPREKKYWTGLAAGYAQLKQDENAMATLALSKVMGLMNKSGEYRNLGQYYAMFNVPYKAATVMEEGLTKGIIEPKANHWRATAGNWQVAQELRKAAKAYVQAAKLDETGQYYVLAGDVLNQLEAWNDAIAQFKLALKKGGLKEKDKGRALMSIGIAYFNLGKYDEAMSWFAKAEGVSKVARQAQQWRNYAASMKKIQEDLAEN